MGNARTHTFEQVMVCRIIRAVQSSTKGYIISRAVALENDAVEAQQRRAVVTAVIHLVFEIRKHRIGKDTCDFREDIVRKRIFERLTDLMRQAFAVLQGHITHKTITHDQVDGALVNVITFDITHKIQIASVSRRSK